MTEKTKKNQKGFVFSLDSAYAIFVVLLASAVIMSMIMIPQEETETTLQLSRIARDITDVNRSIDEALTSSDIEDIYPGIKVNNCGQEDTVVTHEAVIYNGNGEVEINTVEVCPE